MSVLSVVNLFLILIVIIILIFVLVESFRNQEFFFGVIYRIQTGSPSNGIDTFNVGSFDLYINTSNSDLQLTIPASNKNVTGRKIIIRNNSTGMITLLNGSGLSLSAGSGLNLQIPSGGYASLVATSPNTYLRLQ
jgi:hypothetical protein